MPALLPVLHRRRLSGPYPTNSPVTGSQRARRPRRSSGPTRSLPLLAILVGLVVAVSCLVPDAPAQAVDRWARSQLPVHAGSALVIAGAQSGFAHGTDQDCTAGPVLKGTGLIANLSQYQRAVRFVAIPKHCGGRGPRGGLRRRDGDRQHHLGVAGRRPGHHPRRAQDDDLSRLPYRLLGIGVLARVPLRAARIGRRVHRDQPERSGAGAAGHGNQDTERSRVLLHQRVQERGQVHMGERGSTASVPRRVTRARGRDVPRQPRAR